MSPSAWRVDGGFVLNGGYVRLSALHFVLSVLFTFHPFEQKLFSKMQTKPKVPLFASDKDPDHRLAHDWSNILKVNDDCLNAGMMELQLLCALTSMLLLVWNVSLHR